MSAVILLGTLSLVALALAWRRGLSFGRLLLDILGVLVGGVLGAAPGAACSLFGVIQSASGTSPLAAWPAVLFVVGGTAGGLVGLMAMERLGRRTRCPATAWATALAGFLTGVVCSALAASLMAALSDTGGMPAFLILSPLSIAAATVAGYSYAPLKDKNRPPPAVGAGGSLPGGRSASGPPPPREAVGPEGPTRSFSLWSIAAVVLLALAILFVLLLLSFLPKGALAGPAEGGALTFVLAVCFLAAWSCTLLGITTGWVGVRRSRRDLAWPWAILGLHALCFLGMAVAGLIALR